MAVSIAASIGDPAGIGPETLLRAVAGLPDGVTVYAFSPSDFLEQLARRLKLAWPRCLKVSPLAIPQEDIQQIEPGTSGLASGRIQLASLDAATSSVLQGECNALFTAPITKSSCIAAGFAFPGHTEYLAARAGVSQSVMMLAGVCSEGAPERPLRVVPLTGHVPLARVSKELRRVDLVGVCRIVQRALTHNFRISTPRVALAGLNPHAGEGGVLGSEERDWLNKAAEDARDSTGLDLHGPLSADALFAHVAPYDAVLCCYHDQALIPLKMRHRDSAVNITLGLPFTRTSPAHGSALDLSGRGIPRAESTLAALKLALQIVECGSLTESRTE